MFDVVDFVVEAVVDFVVDNVVDAVVDTVVVNVAAVVDAGLVDAVAVALGFAVSVVEVEKVVVARVVVEDVFIADVTCVVAAEDVVVIGIMSTSSVLPSCSSDFLSLQTTEILSDASVDSFRDSDSV